MNLKSSKSQLPNLDVYPITSSEFEWTHSELAKQVINAGAEIIQYREKKKGVRACLSQGRNLRDLTRKHGVTLIVNDRVDLAQAIHADGVHIGQDDIPLKVARRILGNEKIIGVSVENLMQAKDAEEGGADYLGVGPVYSTQTKEDVGSPIGLENLRKISRKVKIPVVGIGGIDIGNAKEVIENGADGVAVISAIAESQNPRKATSQLLETVRKAKR